MIPESLILARTESDGVRRRTRIERRPDGAWDLLEERREGGEWVGGGNERVTAVWVEADLHGEFGRRDRDGVVDAEAGP
ncbi:hypothetical protein Hbl1158_02805 [Halobaculum sp. CBA1158]|uniref:hypothetical protein n=1 Tax=Halobaculum sp. CBA1158 TaxID=2904243 RepID=UPI001F1B7460|nr:hypothetical protein [Halobaculum sp. CBA1158]UIP00317.1 hypothetical protein Hbl1158_02805 [Halobaculum sp. CBA1158]